MAIETVGKPRLRRQQDLVPGTPWYRVSGDKTDGYATSIATGYGTSPQAAWENYQANDPFVFDQFDEDCPF